MGIQVCELWEHLGGDEMMKELKSVLSKRKNKKSEQKVSEFSAKISVMTKRFAWLHNGYRASGWV